MDIDLLFPPVASSIEVPPHSTTNGQMKIELVGGLEHVRFFIVRIVIPTDELIFFRVLTQALAHTFAMGTGSGAELCIKFI